MATHVSLRLFFWWPATKCGEVLYLPLPPYKQPVYHIYVRTTKQGDFRLVVYNILDKIMHINTKIHLLSLLTLLESLYNPCPPKKRDTLIRIPWAISVLGSGVINTSLSNCPSDITFSILIQNKTWSNNVAVVV